MKVYELESDAERYSITLKNQEDKITKLNEIIKKHNDNESIVKKF
jgi:phage-related protein